jgi:hypothetical protein
LFLPFPYKYLNSVLPFCQGVKFNFQVSPPWPRLWRLKGSAQEKKARLGQALLFFRAKLLLQAGHK